MADVWRLLSALLALLAVAALAALLEPQWGRDVGIDRDGLEHLRREFLDSGGRSPQPDAIRQTMRREAEKDRVADDLISGRLTLFEAAALFRRWNAEGAAPPANVALYYAGDSEEERVSRQVIRWAEVVMRQRYPEGADALTKRLEAELRRHKELHGTVVLPDAPGRGGLTAAGP
jgi:hypothetical protein